MNSILSKAMESVDKQVEISVKGPLSDVYSTVLNLIYAKQKDTDETNPKPEPTDLKKPSQQHLVLNLESAKFLTLSLATESSAAQLYAIDMADKNSDINSAFKQTTKYTVSNSNDGNTVADFIRTSEEIIKDGGGDVPAEVVIAVGGSADWDQRYVTKNDDA